MKFIDTDVLHQAYEEHGPSDGEAVILLHGFPYDPRCYDAVAPALAARGYRVIVPYLRGYGPTRFLSRDTLRSGQQAALAHDLRALMDALGIGRAAMAGYDWGGRAACIAAALWPERVTALVTGNGYNIQNIPASVAPGAPEAEHRHWYQFYFHTPRGEAGLEADRFGLGRLLWKLWSPSWRFTPEEYARSAASFENPDFVAVVIQSYRHRFGYAAGDAAFEAIERALEAQPPITVPSINLWGDDDGVNPPPDMDTTAHRFTGRYERRLLPGIGHNIPQEDPQAVVRALLDLMG
ncbi:alpha/beta hydrolase [Rhodovarius crocodyli]|uniref:Alpha/beta hydrolase n=1 Tax=Rhodovarius crocodyli TaxID=1979269 RepID=A0A437MNH0_9PROT|nr:alpha/beta hydrolase [Rhodovarius crocodyli]RVT99193.1 alpha/beta hydrolase [Rhodovarius crocodyli]